ncbi:hypothetical protein PROFUN_05772 [Planoprotostelium fungivorum]|uniref:Uncharacterized protein n=1 Tax=Planoprotostelium fungivorum TaxID=1890364 RepID=A0A2P6NPV8_9EUKA|nr:hypothetical protein PROFUN_05772 [Planoprotostelium fungivorum]
MTTRSRKRPLENSSEEENQRSKKEKIDAVHSDIHVRLSSARQAFTLQEEPRSVSGREKELKEIRDWIQEHIDNGSSSSLYISGRPGSGKTATINQLRKDLVSSQSRTNCVYINCMQFTADRKQVYREISASSQLGSCDTAAEISSLLGSRQSKTKLTRKMQLELAEIFGWTTIESERHIALRFSHEKESRTLVIGIANALDMTDRIPLLSYIKCEPKLMHFRGYTKEEIAKIIQERLPPLREGESPLLDPLAIHLLSQTVASRSGDIRMVLDICRKAVQKIQNRVELDGERAVTKITIADMKGICSGLLYDPVVEEVKSLSVHGQLLLVVLTLWSRKNKKAITGRQLREEYRTYSKKIGIPGVESEVADLCGSLEAFTVMGKQKEFNTRTMGLRISEESLLLGLEDVKILQNLIKQ